MLLVLQYAKLNEQIQAFTKLFPHLLSTFDLNDTIIMNLINPIHFVMFLSLPHYLGE